MKRRVPNFGDCVMKFDVDVDNSLGISPILTSASVNRWRKEIKVIKIKICHVSIKKQKTKQLLKDMQNLFKVNMANYK